MDISAATLSAITDKVIPAMNEWRTRPLESVYAFVYLDCMHYKVREGAKFWLSVLTDLKTRGMQDMLIACVVGLKGFPEAIASIFPQTQIQTCVVHQIRNSLRWSLYYVSSSSVSEKDKKAFIADLKLVYQALTKEEGYKNPVYHRLYAEIHMKLEEKWCKKYPVPISFWYHNWETLSTFFRYDAHIRKVIYTTNIVEGFHRQVRKVTKTKGLLLLIMPC